MPVHYIKVCSHWPDDFPVKKANSIFQNWIGNHREWVEDGASHKVRTSPDNNYLMGTSRFKHTDKKVILLDTIENRFRPHVDWYRIGYHVCDHDNEENRTECEWEDRREYTAPGVTIPDYVEISSDD